MYRPTHIFIKGPVIYYGERGGGSKGKVRCPEKYLGLREWPPKKYFGFREWPPKNDKYWAVPMKKFPMSPSSPEKCTIFNFCNFSLTIDDIEHTKLKIRISLFKI